MDNKIITDTIETENVHAFSQEFTKDIQTNVANILNTVEKETISNFFSKENK